jgi:HPt (histidine-containing phosphotransfer) domain-containing protein
MLYDLSMLKKLANDDEVFIVDILQTFVNTAPPALQRMREYLCGNNMEALGREAHKLIPGVSFLGAQQLKDILVNIEENAKCGAHTDQMPLLVTAASEQTEALVQCFMNDFNIPIS